MHVTYRKDENYTYLDTQMYEYTVYVPRYVPMYFKNPTDCTHVVNIAIHTQIEIRNGKYIMLSNFLIT